MDKEQIICKYKFRNKEKFDGKPYCTCFCELCEDLQICVHNCQIFEDYKQLARKTAECELLETQLESYYIGEAKLVQRNQELEQECEQIKEKYEALKLENEEGYEIADELKQECEELKKQLETSEKWRIKAESLNENFELKNTCYRRALEEIEKYLQTQLDGFGNDVYEMQKSAINNIRNIISRAKEG